MQIRIQENINAGLRGIDQLSTIYLAFGKYSKKVGIQYGGNSQIFKRLMNP